MNRRMYFAYRRKRLGKTNYKKRLELLKSHSLRVVIRKSLKAITVQAIIYEANGDKTLFTSSSKELAQYGWTRYGRNTPAAYLVGYLFGMKAQQKRIHAGILDQGLYPTRQGTIIFSVLKGLIDAGMNIPHDPKIFPHNDRIEGKHISKDIAQQFAIVKANIQKVK